MIFRRYAADVKARSQEPRKQSKKESTESGKQAAAERRSNPSECMSGSCSEKSMIITLQLLWRCEDVNLYHYINRLHHRINS